MKAHATCQPKANGIVHTTSTTPSAQSPHAPSPHGQSLCNGATATREFGCSSTSTVDPPATEVLLSPAGTFVTGDASTPDDRGERHRQLAIAIRQRIESRLSGRVRNLAVRIIGDTIVLEGQCATYYTKQLAQHAAMGVLEDEQLENAIVVSVPRE